MCKRNPLSINELKKHFPETFLASFASSSDTEWNIKFSLYIMVSKIIQIMLIG